MDSSTVCKVTSTHTKLMAMSSSEVQDKATPASSFPARLEPAIGGASGERPAGPLDTLAKRLIALHVTPNMLTVAGFVLTCGAAVCLLIGAGHAPPWEAEAAPTPVSWWPMASAAMLTLAFAMDLLDGIVARVGGLSSRFGAFLDSTLDRCSDLVLLVACGVHFALIGNATYVALCFAAAANAVLISYIKARAENFVERCGVGFWQRPERCVAFLAAAHLGHIPAALGLLGTLPALTVIRRIRHTRAAIEQKRSWEPAGWLGYLMPWRARRGSPAYVVCAAAVVAFLLAGPLLWPLFYGAADPLRKLLGSCTGR